MTVTTDQQALQAMLELYDRLLAKQDLRELQAGMLGMSCQELFEDITKLRERIQMESDEEPDNETTLGVERP